MNKIRLNESELKKLIINIISEYNNRKKISSISVEVDMETDNGSVFTISGELSYGNVGIGSYEFWGQQGNDVSYDFQVENFKIVPDSYNEEDIEDINQWIDNNEHKIELLLIDKARDEYGDDDEYYDEM